MRRFALTTLRWLFTLGALSLVLRGLDGEALTQSIEALPAHVPLIGLGLLMLRDLGFDLLRWQSTLESQRVLASWRGLLAVQLESAAIRQLLPFKLGEVARVALVARRSKAPVRLVLWSRLLSMGLLLGAGLLLLAALTLGLALPRPWGPVAGLVVAALGSLAGLAIAGRFAIDEGPLPRAGAFAVASITTDLALYSLLLPGPAATGLPASAAVILASALPLSYRGLGIRELLLTRLLPDLDPTPLVAAGLAISSLELSWLLMMGLAALLLPLLRRALAEPEREEP